MSAFQTRMVIVGAGFAGLSAAKALRRVPVQVTVVDQHDYHTFKPFLYQVATALLGADASAYPTRGEVRRLANVLRCLTRRLDLARSTQQSPEEKEAGDGRLSFRDLQKAAWSGRGRAGGSGRRPGPVR